MNPQICPFCKSSVSLVDSAKVYGRSYGFIYLCDRFPLCDARVSCQPNSNKPLGTLADRELRQWRSLAHRHFDPLWKSGIFKSRNAAYKWLARAMGLPRAKTHVAMFDKKQCQRAIAVVRQFQQIANSSLLPQENNMKPSAIANSINNWLDMVAVWEREDEKWQLLRLVRPKRAIALYWKNPEVRLVFPVGVDPNYVGKEALARKKRKYNYKPKQQGSDAKERQRSVRKMLAKL